MYKYFTIDSNNIVVGITNINVPATNPAFISVDEATNFKSFDNPIGKKYDSAKKTLSVVPSTERIKTENEVNTLAEQARQKLVTPGAGMMEVYKLKYDESAAYIAAGYPVDDTAYPMIATEASAAGTTTKAIADLVLATRNAWFAALGTIEAERSKAKVKISSETTNAGFKKIVDVFKLAVGL